MALNIAGAVPTPLVSRLERMSMLLWGRSGCGKTVLASTAPGPILWLNFDPDGAASISRNADIEVVDLSSMDHTMVPKFKSKEVVETQIRSALTQDRVYSTLVFDSVTSFAQLALTHAVVSGKANGGKFTSTIEAPGMAGYGIRNRLVLDSIRMVLRVTGSLGVNVIIICHEDVPKTNTEGAIESITLLLGGSLTEEVPLMISEVWHMLDNNGKRTVGLRPYGMRTPMRTRMFRLDGQSTSFPLAYDQHTDKGDSIRDWFAKWKSNGFSKIPAPK